MHPIKHVAIGLAAGIVLVIAAAIPILAQGGTTYFVNATTGSDSNTCLATNAACLTITEAISKATSGDTIEIAAGTYTENILVEKALTLHGAGAETTIIDGGGVDRVLYVSTETVIVSDIGLTNGNAPAGFEYGGGVMNFSNLTLQRVRVFSNTAGIGGGGIASRGGSSTLLLVQSNVISNHSSGNAGGVYSSNDSTVTISDTVISGNTASEFGGGFSTNSTTPTTINHSTIQNNQANFGGGISNSGLLIIEKSTIAENSAVGNAGGIYQDISGILTATNVTVSGNHAGSNYGGVLNTSGSMAIFFSTIANNSRQNTAGAGYNGIAKFSGASITIGGTIVANNAERQCNDDGTWTSTGYNLSSDNRCNSFVATGDLQVANANLSALGDFGGSTATHLLLAGSDAIDAGGGTCPPTDQRDVSRPVDGNGDTTATCDIGAVEMRNQVSVSNASATEGNSGTTTAVFTLTLAPAATENITVTYTATAETATAGVDYSVSGTEVIFSPGITTATINTTIFGDTDDEPDETFRLQFASPNADLLNSSATGTIIDDDGLSSLSISGGQTVMEGNTGTQTIPLTVTLSPASSQPVSVNYATEAGTATAGSDFVSNSGTLSFAVGETGKTITVTINNDEIDEFDETFGVRLSSPTNAILSTDYAAIDLQDNDTASFGLTPSPRMDVTEGNIGTTAAVFTVTMSIPAEYTATVDYNTFSNAGTLQEYAVAGVDYISATGTLTFNPGVVEQNISVQIYGDTEMEGDEYFWLQLTNAAAPAIIGTSQSQINILNDDFYVYLPLILR